MITILEGPDGAGKTQLASKLCKTRGYYYLHNGPYLDLKPDELFRTYTKQLVEYDGVVIDRSFLSEEVYGNVIREKNRLGQFGRVLMERLCEARNVKQVICLPPEEVCLTNWELKHRTQSDYVTKREKAVEVYNYYKNLLDTPVDEHETYLHYDYTWELGMTRDDLVKVETLMNRLMFWGSDPLPPGIVGSRRARWLFVGDQVNPKRAWVDLPFFNLTGVSGYLWKAMLLAGVREEDAAFVNSVDLNHKTRDFWQDLHFLREAKVIALGEAPHLLLTLSGVTHERIPHPSYWMRFHYRDLAGYAKLIKEAIE